MHAFDRCHDVAGALAEDDQTGPVPAAAERVMVIAVQVAGALQQLVGAQAGVQQMAAQHTCEIRRPRVGAVRNKNRIWFL